MKQDIDLTRLTEDELIALNRQVVERLRFLRQTRSYQAMAAFNIGDTVSFTPEAGKIVVGTVVRLNQKTVTVVTKDGHNWRVAPSFLSRTTDANSLDRPRVDGGQGDVVLLHELSGKGRPWR
ncbi:MAG: hypothetical protein A2289_20685 [Deltaproteobacteria bacterium RIFOXYA12_FULL_58_15]|nr:MAG: hypothetical protein A2289_20685 [Deltaproteobacteria bacterium RIFOXYA12_FULL_58_15]OGR08409.1 MAG: hypothetical protein A2341_17375 [Deltaproteobacteria bacterium RIFOXYB12_FULL_58_9]